MSKIVAFLAYESPWFPAGGVAAVMAHLPVAVANAAGLPVVVVTPFHRRSTKLAALPLQRIQKINVPCDGANLSVAVYHAQLGCPWYFLKPEGDAHFHGQRHPYDEADDVLLHDALFFGAAAVQALATIAWHQSADPTRVEWNLIAQDWEAATALLAFASQHDFRGRLHLTLHNSYDAYASFNDLYRAGIDPHRCPGDTIVHRAFSVIEPPAFTVSEQFALDFTDDLLQREIMAPHLQPVLHRHPIRGVANGPFKPLAVDPAHLHEATAGNFGPLQSWKAANRFKALAALDAHAITETEPIWGNRDQFRRERAPWLVMSGRDDPRQKGYDVAAAAVEDFLLRHHGKPDCAQFLLFPMPGDEGLPGLEFLKTLAFRFPEDVIVCPFIWVAGFSAALQAAAFGLMPSLYEPFGMANEFYLSGGSVGIARATGGNIEQIVPLRASASFGRAVQVRADRHHAMSAPPTGILFREKDELASAAADWRGINEAAYNKAGGLPSRVQQRRQFPLFQAMADELRVAIEDGIRVFTVEPALYHRMLADGVAHLQRSFSWQRAGQEYARKIG